MESSSHSYLSPASLIQSARAAHPAFRYAIVVAGLAAIVAVVLRFGISPATLVFGIIVLIVLMVLFFVFAQAVTVAKARLALPALVLIWTFLFLGLGTAVCLFSSAFFNIPLPLQTAIIRITSPASGGGRPERRDGGQETGSSPRECNLSEELSTAKWIFQVCNIREENEYAERYYQKQRVIRPQGGNDILIIIDARLKNRLQRTQSPILTERQPGNTGLIDDGGYSYRPIDYDARQRIDKTMSFEGASLIPGTMLDFALVFSVPRGTKPKFLVFTLRESLKSSEESGRTDLADKITALSNTHFT